MCLINKMQKRIRWLIFLIPLFLCSKALCQPQDVDFHLNAHLFNGQKLIKVKRNFNDNYLWVLGEGNRIYRVNSLTLAFDDYTSKFTAYKKFQFVDLMGHSGDTLFIATNTTSLIEYANGNIRVFGTADGIPGAINSLGIDRGWNMSIGSTMGEMIIGTNKGMRTFNVKSQKIGTLPDGDWAGNTSIADSRIYESTYRAETFKDSLKTDRSGWDSDTLHYLPVCFNTAGIYQSDAAFYIPYVWEGNKTFGNKINTVHTVNDALGNNRYGYFASFLWGSEKGMFQNTVSGSEYTTFSSWARYLNNIKVNKITDIMGLTSFSNSYSSLLIKKNLLIGTDNGFYFSSTMYSPGGSYPPKFALFHDTDLGSTVINDICVNAVPNAQPICENGVWLAANDGLYLLKPDYGKYFSNQKQKLISFRNQPDTLSQLQICALSPVTATVQSDYSNIQWYKDGAELPGQSKDTLAITAAGEYNAVIYDPCEGLHIESNHIKVSVISGPVFTFNYPPKLQYCDSTSTTLNVTYSAVYRYRWYKDGTLTGDTTSSLIVNQSGKYKVELSACTNSWVPSSSVQVDLVNLPQPGITSDKNVYCQSDTALLTTNLNADPSYTLNWYRDNILLNAFKDQPAIKTSDPGNYTVKVNSHIAACTKSSASYQLKFTQAPTFTFNYPNQLQYCAGTPLTLQVSGSAAYQYRWYKDGALNDVVSPSLPVTEPGKYYVEVSSCGGSWVPSKEVEVTFAQVPVPVIASNKPVYCIGDNATLSLKNNVDPSYVIKWYKENVLLPYNTNQTFIITNVPGNYTVMLVNSMPNTDGTICSQTSAGQVLTFNPHPTISIEKIVPTTLCEGQTIRLLALYNGGSVRWSTGETTDQINVTMPGNYKATLTSIAGCQADTNVAITFLSNPVLSVNDTSICTYKNQVVTLTAPSGFLQYEWNGAMGGQTYQVTRPQTVNLRVTDANGCQASQLIKVADRCPNIYIPNTFTPNGDGINDTWIIEGLDDDPTSNVKIFTRYGNLIFEDKGHNTTWNGEYNGKKLPAGVYYYVVTAKKGTQKFSGSVTIIY
jgi:gliding motility-associated-like protein